jgi:Tfp pilus assembly protein PilN
MINLLPPEIKNSYRYARRNVALRRWVIICLVALIGLAGLATYGLLTLHQSTITYNNKITAANNLFKQEKFSETQTEVKDASNSFKLAVKVLGQEILFSKLIQQITATIPDGANLTELDINQTQGGIDISANATDYHTATQVQVNLSDPNNKIFSKADIIGINCVSTNAANPQYPCLITIRALFASNNPFLFINSKASTP